MFGKFDLVLGHVFVYISETVTMNKHDNFPSQNKFCYCEFFFFIELLNVSNITSIFLFYKQCTFVRAFAELLLTKVRINLVVPSSWSLTKSIQCFFKLVHIDFLYILISRRLVHMHIFTQFTMKKSTLPIELLNIKIHTRC